MENSNDLWGKNGIPYMTASKFTALMRDYDEKCKTICHFIRGVFELYDWQEADEDGERNALLQLIAYKLVTALKMIHEVFNLRIHQIRDEHCECFDQLVTGAHQREKSFKNFLVDADTMLQAIIHNGGKPMEYDMLRIIGNFRPKFKVFSVWLQGLAEQENGDWAKKVAEKYDELGVDFHTEMFCKEADGFRQQSYIVLNCLTLLAIPMHRFATDEEFLELLRNSFDTFRNSHLWKYTQQDYEAWLKNSMLKKNIEGKLATISYLKERWRELREEKDQLLQSFGIRYCCINNKEMAGKLGRQLYERLNWIELSDAEELEVIRRNYQPKKMTNNDLCQYFTIEAKIQFLTDWIEDLKKVVESKRPNNNYFFDHIYRDPIFDAMEKIIIQKNKFKMQSHWICFYKVLDYHQLACNNLTLYAKLMRNDWFPNVECRCDYDSLKNLRFAELKDTPHTEWAHQNPRLYVYWQIAKEFEENLRDYGVI